MHNAPIPLPEPGGILVPYLLSRDTSGFVFPSCQWALVIEVPKLKGTLLWRPFITGSTPLGG